MELGVTERLFWPKPPVNPSYGREAEDAGFVEELIYIVERDILKKNVLF